MKKINVIFSFFTFLTTQAFANEIPEVNTLKDACGYIALSEEHIKGLYSWGETKEVYIGAENHFKNSDPYSTSQNFGVIFKKNAHFSSEGNLTHISFENSEVDFPTELIAEREPLKLNQTTIEMSEIPQYK